MKFAIAVHGTRGDVEPVAAVGLELMRRGHEVRMAVPPNLVEFTESAGFSDVQAYGPDSQQQLEAEIFREWYKLRNPLTVLRQAREYVTDGWAEMSDTLVNLADGVDLILTGTTYQEVAANVAEAQGVPLAALHYFPARANSYLIPVRLPMRVVEPAFAVAEWAHWRILKPADDAQRRKLGLPESQSRATKRIVDNGALEIQAYDKVLFPRLEGEWGPKRPLVGSMSLQMATDEDSTVMDWVQAGTAPIYFGFGSMPVADPAAAVAMIRGVCGELGQRALVCSGVLALEGIPDTPDMMIVPSVNHAAVFPKCRAIVHHGGAGTTAASLRSGIPTLVLWVGADQPVWAEAVKRSGAGTSHRFSTTTAETLRKDLATVLGPACTARAREVATQMTPVERSVATTADLLEQKAAARTGR